MGSLICRSRSGDMLTPTVIMDHVMSHELMIDSYFVNFWLFQWTVMCYNKNRNITQSIVVLISSSHYIHYLQ